MLIRSVIQRLPSTERTLIRDGAIFTGLLTGMFGYANYREFIKKEFYRSEGHYRFEQRAQNCTPWKQMYFTWYRMPKEEWTVYHRFKSYFVLGQLDQSKEILIPRTKVVNGTKKAGFDVISPLYCYEGGSVSFKNTFAGENPVDVDRAAIIVNRGWIPANKRDKRSRPTQNSRKLVRMTGTWRRGKDIHDYKVPNNPDNNEWNNLALEDIGRFWDLPNFSECKYYYF